MDKLAAMGYTEPLKEYIRANKPFMGICVGMQCLGVSSEESPGVAGLGIVDAVIAKFDASTKTVPHMGWNAAAVQIKSAETALPAYTRINHSGDSSRYYFVHSFAIKSTAQTMSASSNLAQWTYSLTSYGDETFVSSIQRGNIFATQFHPEKSGSSGLAVLEAFLSAKPEQLSQAPSLDAITATEGLVTRPSTPADHLSRRIIACLDVRTNDAGDLVVTKGDQYDVREAGIDGSNEVRNLGKPVELARRYFEEGADEVTFLNITSFRDCPVTDLPMLQVLERTSESVFVPLTIGGGIREIVEPSGHVVSALDVAGEYFRSGADKVSIGSDAVYAAEAYWARGGAKAGDTAIEQIAAVYGAQAVVVSVDPRRVYVSSPEEHAAQAGDKKHHLVRCDVPGPNGETWCWYQCTVKGGREGRDLDVKQLVVACEALGAGEILLNCMDRDGTNSGFEHSLIADVKQHVRIPVIASSGAGCVEHFSQVFSVTNVDAALAAGIFHRREVPLLAVKEHLASAGFPTRLV
ncbi:hypothetical protein BC831DRAFT_439994 [Entophlyctis helioformis]|nr:hypothetical protein BC831DRAFT_439994 [Entophlyctis helioformis]